MSRVVLGLKYGTETLHLFWETLHLFWDGESRIVKLLLVCFTTFPQFYAIKSMCSAGGALQYFPLTFLQLQPCNSIFLSQHSSLQLQPAEHREYVLLLLLEVVAPHAATRVGERTERNCSRHHTRTIATGQNETKAYRTPRFLLPRRQWRPPQPTQPPSPPPVKR